MKVLFIISVAVAVVFLVLLIRQCKKTKQISNTYKKYKIQSEKVLLDKEKKLREHINDYRSIVNGIAKLEATQPSRDGYSPRKYTNRCCLQLSTKIHDTHAIEHNDDKKTICLYVIKPATIKKHNINRKQQVAHEIN